MKQSSQYAPTTAENNSTDELIVHNLTLTPEQRLIQHQNALDTINELKKARTQVYGESESPSQTPPRK